MYSDRHSIRTHRLYSDTQTLVRLSVQTNTHYSDRQIDTGFIQTGAPFSIGAHYSDRRYFREMLERDANYSERYPLLQES